MNHTTDSSFLSQILIDGTIILERSISMELLNTISSSMGLETDDTTVNAAQRREKGDHATVDDRDNLWRASPFAIGPSYVQWSHEESCLEFESCIGLSSCCCRFGCGRVGNMVVLCESSSQPKPDCGGTETTAAAPLPPRLWCIVGPYWPVFLCITLPLIIGISLFVGLTRVRYERIEIVVAWSCCTLGLLISLLSVSCRNPGILPRHRTCPPNDDGDTNQEEWLWNDQAQTFRPPGAKYDTECKAVIKGFDHVCPWTGTAIGTNNMCAFRFFLIFLFGTLMFDVFLVAFLSIPLLNSP